MRGLAVARRGALPLSLLLSLLLAGCGGGGSNGGSSSSPSPAPVTPAAPLSASAVTPSGLTATLAQNTATVAPGGSVTYTLTLTNNTSRSVTFFDALNPDGSGTLPGAISQITDAQGNVLYPPQAGPVGAGPVGLPTTTYTLAPGRSLSQTIAQPFSFPAGSYTTTASFLIVPSSTASLQDTPISLTVTVQ